MSYTVSKWLKQDSTCESDSKIQSTNLTLQSWLPKYHTPYGIDEQLPKYTFQIDAI